MFFQDLRFALRQFSRSAGFGLTAVVMLALGVGSSVAIFSFVDAALIKPLPYADPTRLAAVTETVAAFGRANLSYPDYLDWKRMNKVFRSLDVYTGAGYLLRTPSGSEPLPAARVSDGFFRTLGVKPVLGRDFHAGEDQLQTAPVVLLSYATWRRRFGGRAEIVGQTISLSGVAHTVIGVLPASFHFAPRGNAELWTALQPTDGCLLRRSCHSLNGVARLQDGVSMDSARADIVSIAAQLERQYPDSNRGQGGSLIPLQEEIVGDIRPILFALSGGAGLLLLIACVNISSLLVVRSESRRREIGVRGALGASPARLGSLFLAEALLLVALGSVAGLATAQIATQAMLHHLSKDMIAKMPYLAGMGMNLRVVGFAAAVALVGVLLFWLTPALRLSAVGIGAEMRSGIAEGGRGSSGSAWRRIGANLVIVELAIAMVLLVGAGLLAKSFYGLLHVDLNFEPDHLATLYVSLSELSYPKDPQVIAAQREILRRISLIPGVKSVALTSKMPVEGNGNTDWIRIEGKPYNGIHNEVNTRDVSPAYFTALQAKLIRGRFFTHGDDAAKPLVAVITREFARKYFPGEDPVGKRFGDTSLTPKTMRTIIGVVDNIRESSLDTESLATEYLSSNQSPDTYFAVIARTTQDEAAVLPQIAEAIRKVNPEIGVVEAATMSERINDSQSAYLHRSAAWLVGGFAALALLLGAVGVYGVIAYSVSQRTREIGVRMALGAQRASVYQLVLKQAGWLSLLGIASGLILAIGAAQFLGGLLFGVTAWDLPTLGLVSVVVGACSMLASYFPARRAASVNPVDALRAE